MSRLLKRGHAAIAIPSRQKACQCACSRRTFSSSASSSSRWQTAFETFNESSRARRDAFQEKRPKDDVDGRTIVAVSGLSPNLDTADFYRFVPSSLSSWGESIVRVQHDRNVSTFDSLGRYLLTFESRFAAEAFVDRLRASHDLAHRRATSTSALWEAGLPHGLQAIASESDVPGTGTSPAERLADLFTLAPGTQQHISITLGRANVKLSRNDLDEYKRKKDARVEDEHEDQEKDWALGWENRLKKMRGFSGYGDTGYALMIDVSPPTLTEDDLLARMHHDWPERGVRWAVSPPTNLLKSWITTSFVSHAAGILGQLGKEGKTSEQAQARAAFQEARQHLSTLHPQSKALPSEDDEENGSGSAQGGESPLAMEFLRKWGVGEFATRPLDRMRSEKLRGRFVAFGQDEGEARRFRRYWNGRTLQGWGNSETGMNTIRVSLLN